MVGFLPAHRRKMQHDAGCNGECPPELLHQLVIKRRVAEDLLAGKLDLCEAGEGVVGATDVALLDRFDP